MKYIYHAAVALCLLIAVQRSNSQKRTFELEPGENELIAISANDHPSSRSLGRSPDYAGSEEIQKPSSIIDMKIPDPVFDVVGLHIDRKSNGYLIRIHCTKYVPDFESWFKPIGDDTWLYVTLADAKADVAVLQDFEPTAFVKKVLIFQSATSVQLTFLLKGRVNSVELVPAERSRDILTAVFMPAEDQFTIRKTR